MEGKTKACMNAVCASSNTAAVEWEKGWPLQSGGCATLCHNCGTAYKELVFCEMFHSEDTGWRECTSCGKRLHCGCVASSLSLVLLDAGGVNCIGCSKSSKLPHTASQEKLTAQTENGSSQKFDPVVSAQTSDDIVMDCSVAILPAKLGNDFSAPGEVGYRTEMNFNQSFIELAKNDDMLQESLRHESLAHMNLSIGLSASSNLNPLSLSITEEKESSSGISSHQQVFRTHHLLPKLSNSILAAGPETKSRIISPTRVARPPVEGRVKNQLLPRYWPRITDQELQQISGDSNSTIVPLFEKVLSASDAGRIGRLVLPKACAEAYFPPISQPEGLPLRIQDQKGKEWVFQFRFWPNNNSRMYVLEGVTPCIQSLQLQAGDTVTFSRMDPEGKLLMGFRKASNSVSIKDSHSSINIGAFSGDTLMAAAENLHVMNDYSGLLQPSKGNRNSSLSLFSKHVNSPQIEKNGSKPGDNQALQLPERKRSQNIGPKSKRLLMDGQDALELKLSWDELQDFLRPLPSAEPSTIAIEDHEFEEFEEPPVFGKRSIFIARLSGEQEQWAQCDSCFKWRKVPYDLLLPPKWTCHVNGNVQTRSSCAAPDELNALELENLLKMNKEFKRRRVGTTSLKSMQGQESPEVVEIVEKASSVVGGGDIISSEAGGGSSSAAATTTRHPRHRPGCSCIVCIQPPSGKGKHKPTCTCNVCMTVKRRFKTLMMRKQKRQSEREEAQIADAAAKEEAEVDSIVSFPKPKQVSSSENELLPSRQQFQENAETCSVKLDLNCCPGSRQDQRGTPCTSRISMVSLVQEASLPLETYLRQNGLTSLLSDQQQPTSPSPHVVSQVSEDILTHADTQVNQNLSEESDGFSGKDQGENELS